MSYLENAKQAGSITEEPVKIMGVAHLLGPWFHTKPAGASVKQNIKYARIEFLAEICSLLQVALKSRLSNSVNKSLKKEC